KKRSRVGYKIEKGKKTRIARKSGEEVKKTSIAKKKDAKALDKATDKAVEKASEKTEAKKASAKKEKPASAPAKSTAGKKSPFWKKMGFGEEAAGAAGAEVDAGSHMSEDHSVPDQVERSSSRSSQRGS
ncbi:MAG: hypothetical protein QF793_02440, partial [Candidatus Peribacteraceae bacterium]|nr:hypothetical protein [Candidatus Peribacteraceae bacterium]